MTLPAIAQLVASGLLIGLIYALIAAGLSLIFGLMDVVNFAHGEFLMTSMYVTLGIYLALNLDPILIMPATALVMAAFGVFVYRVVVRRALAAKVNSGMVQIFATFGLGIAMRGIAQLVWTPEYRSIKDSVVADKTLEIAGVFLPLPQLAAGGVCLVAFLALYLLIQRTDFGRALEATREDSEAVSLIGIDRHKIFALGWALGAAAVGVAGAMLATFYYVHPGVGSTFALIAYVTVATGGFGSLLGALAAGLLVGLVEAGSAVIMAPALKQLGIFALYLLTVLLRPRGLFGKL
ncbi:branched-chain amino acid ABC transporter permease [Lacibacterium aquatile]|uniref:Branched-chain amino acid ABC transporter permease n=1 Tax=Lacibacterium aquatile TaxID=1168082 RepID=A0ABW5DQV5_9PROT